MFSNTHSFRFAEIGDTDADRTVAAMSLTVLRTPVRVPTSNTFCERSVGTIRRECLDLVIPVTERHLRNVLRAWVGHYNRRRPHVSLGPGTPDPLSERVRAGSDRHRLPLGHWVSSTPISAGFITRTDWNGPPESRARSTPFVLTGDNHLQRRGVDHELEPISRAGPKRRRLSCGTERARKTSGVSARLISPWSPTSPSFLNSVP
jgi:hypothetical protein